MNNPNQAVYQLYKIIGRSYLVPTHFVTTYCQLPLQFTLNLLKIETSFFSKNFHQRVQVSGKYRRNHQEETNKS